MSTIMVTKTWAEFVDIANTKLGFSVQPELSPEQYDSVTCIYKGYHIPSIWGEEAHLVLLSNGKWLLRGRVSLPDLCERCNSEFRYHPPDETAVLEYWDWKAVLFSEGHWALFYAGSPVYFPGVKRCPECKAIAGNPHHFGCSSVERVESCGSKAVRDLTEGKTPEPLNRPLTGGWGVPGLPEHTVAVRWGAVGPKEYVLTAKGIQRAAQCPGGVGLAVKPMQGYAFEPKDGAYIAVPAVVKVTFQFSSDEQAKETLSKVRSCAGYLRTECGGYISTDAE